MVGSAIGTKMIQLGYQVKMDREQLRMKKLWLGVTANGDKASQGTFSDAASYGEIIFNCCNGMASLEVMKLAGATNLKGRSY